MERLRTAATMGFAAFMLVGALTLAAWAQPSGGGGFHDIQESGLPLTGGTLTGNLILGGARSTYGARTVTIDDWNNCAGDTVKVYINGDTNVATTFTEGVDWIAGGSDEFSATGLAAVINLMAETSATSGGTDVVTLTPADSTTMVEIEEGDATCTTIGRGSDALLNLGKVQFEESFLVRRANHVHYAVRGYDDDGAHIAVSPTDTQGNNNLIIGTTANWGKNCGHNPASADPTVIVHSGTSCTSATDEWGSVAHNKTNMVISSGKGAVSINAVGLLPAKVTGDPCGGGGYPEGSLFYNDTADELCFCNAAGADLLVKDAASACF